MKKERFLHLLFLPVFFLIASPSVAQLSGPGAVAVEETQYPVFEATDKIFIFCTESENIEAGALQVDTDLGGTKTFLWEKYNPETAAFESILSESTEAQASSLSSLASGCYRATIQQGETTQVFRGWVFNNWFSVSGNVTNSNCESFQLSGTFISSGMKYYDLADNSELEVFKDVKMEWKEGEAIIATVQNPRIFSPPPRDTEYTLRVYDRFGCEETITTTYESIVTEAAFSADPMEGEAPLTVTFTNDSENGDPDQFEWFFFRDLDEIKKESEGTLQPVDSIMIVAYDQSPVYTYENSGTYQVKLVSKKISEFYTCVDTAYLEDFIVVDTSFVAVPNVFTPNGDGTNDEFVVKYWSMRSIKISIFNRWGKRIHFWESEDVRGFENTFTETVWDGRMGNRFASPGVYYYVVEGEGRDFKKRKAHGFFHLFRDRQ